MTTKKRTNPKRRRRSAEKRSNYRTPAQWLTDALTGGSDDDGGVTVNEHTALTYNVVFACVRNISEDVAKLPLILYRRLKPRGKERASELALYRLLKDSPNVEMTAIDFRQSIMVDALLGGNGFAEIVKNAGGLAVELHKLARNRVTVTRDAAGRLVYVVRNDGKPDSILQQDQMLHIRGLGDGLVGWSVIRLARESIGLAMNAEKSGSSFFGNGSLPAGVLKTKDKLDAKGYDNLRASWERMHSGPKKTGKVAILEQGLEFTPMSVSPDDAQFLETRQFQVEDVARWFRMPPHKIGNLIRATGWSTLEATNTDYVIDTLMPWTERWEQEIQRKLIPPSQTDLFAEHLFDALLRGDTAARSAFYREQFNIGAISQNEIRESENRNPIGPEGDMYYVPLNMVPANIAAKGPQPAQPPETPAEPTPKAEPDPNAMRNKVKAIEAAHAPLLSDAYARVLKLQHDRCTPASRKADFPVWAEQFYRDHTPHVRVAIGGVLEAFRGSVCAAAGMIEPPEAVIRVVNDEINRAAERHAGASLAALTGGLPPEETWLARADAEAKAELSAVSKLILDFAGKEVQP